MPTRCIVPLLFLVAFLLFPAQSRTQAPKAAEKVTLAKAVEQASAKADELTAEQEKQAAKLGKIQADSGVQSKKSADARAAFVKLAQQKTDAVLDAESLALLARQPREADEMKAIEEWLTLARQIKLPEAEPAPAIANDPKTDKRVKDTPKEAEESVESLATYLTKDAKSDREKARAIFLWITDNVSYDIEGAAARRVEKRPLEIIRGKSTSCAGYSALFAALAEAAGLEASVVGGDLRQATIMPELAQLGTRTPSGCVRAAHGWNVVKIDGHWQLVDCTLASGQFRKKDKIEVNHPTRPFFFCCPPDKMILSHLPKDSQWQLLKTPLSSDEQDSLPVLREAYYENGLQLVSHPVVQISARKDLLMTFRVPRDVFLTAYLYQDEKRLDDEPAMIQRQGDLVDVRFVFPQAGKYTVRIFAAKMTSDKKRTSLPAIDYLVEAAPGPDRGARLAIVDSKFQHNEGRLYWPLSGTLKAGQSQPFLISAPGAASLTVFAGNQKVKLTPVGNGLFAGNIQPPAGPLTIGCVYNTDLTVATEIIKFKVE